MAAQTLVRQSEQASDAGRYGEARALLERALRIEPNNPRVWLAFSELELKSGSPAQARAMAQKALSLAGRDAALESSAQRLLRDAGG